MQKKKIILVESDSTDRSLMVERFNRLGYEVSAVGDGLRAFEKIARDHYDLVMTELNPPHEVGDCVVANTASAIACVKGTEVILARK